MKKLTIAVLAGFMSLAVGAYAAEDAKKADMKKGDMKAAAPAPAPAGDMKADAPKAEKKAKRRAKAAKG